MSKSLLNKAWYLEHLQLHPSFIHLGSYIMPAAISISPSLFLSLSFLSYCLQYSHGLAKK